jgi:hypothetical protein|tara:strand:+ start:400 stop:651 length:252 start_codon:yes stop_codon:yes gene_type:complete
MYNFKIGDLVCKKAPNLKKPIKIGIVVEFSNEGFIINWTSVDENYFMTKTNSIFQELNNYYLLGTHYYLHEEDHPFLSLLNSN